MSDTGTAELAMQQVAARPKKANGIRTVIRPNEVFDRVALRTALGLKDATISREVRMDRLKKHRRAGRDYFIGSEILEWLTSAPAYMPEDDD